MSITLPDIGVIDRMPPDLDRVGGLFAGAVHGEHAVVLSGADGRAWWGPAITSGDLVLALWTAPGEPIVVYGGDPGTLEARLNGGTVVVLAGGGLDLELNPAWSRLDRIPAAAHEWFGSDVVVSTEDPTVAALRLAGPADEAGAVLGVMGATATLLGHPGSGLAAALASAGAQPASCLTVVGSEYRSVYLRLAWTRSLGAFQIRVVGALDGIDHVVTGSLGDIATVRGRETVRGRAASLLSGGADSFDVVAGAEPGGITSFVTDLVTAFAGASDVVVTGNAVPARSVLVLRGTAARAARRHLDLVEPARVGVVLAPAEGETERRYEAHQWVGAMRRAAEALDDSWPIGGPTLASEARSIGMVWPSGETGALGLVDGRVVARIAAARQWRVIDPDLRSVLDPVLEIARRQLAGSDEAVPSSALSALRRHGEDPGFWPDLLSSVEVEAEDRLVFPFPPASVEILRGVVAAGGDAERLRAWLGPVKSAVFRGLRGSRDD